MNNPENNSENENISEEKEINLPVKNKKNPIVRFFVVLLVILLAFLLLICGLLAYSALDRKSALSSIPRNYSIYVHTDSAFDTINPLFDLEAADVYLSSPEFSALRKVFMDFRSSSLRENPLVRFAASRPVDFALYGGGTTIGLDAHFVAVLNMGLFSFASRAGQFLYPKTNLEVENLSFESNEQTSYFVYKIPAEIDENGKVIKNEISIYFKSMKNLVIASDSFEHMLTASLVQNDTSYTSEQRKLFKQGKKGELRIVADALSLLHFATEGNEILSSMSNLISSDSLSVISFNIDDSDISLKCRIPLSSESEEISVLMPLVSRKSTVPAMLAHFSDVTQYYTILNTGNFEDLKNAVLPFVPDIKDPEKFWKDCDDLCKSILGMDLNEFIFSWIGNEACVLGVENQNDPVFAIQIKDEKKRQAVFNKLTSSILIKDDNSLILGGVRLSRLEFPSFLNWLLSIFKINLPSPYFMVLDGNIYFSESSECLSSIYTNSRAGKSLIKNKNYIAVSENQKNEAALSLYYNLERSIPFFLRSNENFSKVLHLYTMGRFDLRFEKSVMELSLHACARKSGNLYAVPGFPLALAGKASPANLQVDSGKSPKNVYWVEDNNSIKALNLSSMNVVGKSNSDSVMIVASAKPKGNGLLWSVTEHGYVSLLDSSLETLEGFPLMLGENISCRPCSAGENLILVSQSGNVFIVKPDSSYVSVEIPDLKAKSEPVALAGSDNFVIYSKSFLGKIFYFEGDKCLNLEAPFEVPGIALGSPSLIKSGSKVYIGFITQAGEMNLWRADSKDGEQAEGFPMRLGGVFMTNVVSSEKYFYALSTDAVLYRISLDGQILSVQIPNSTARHGFISVRRSGQGNRSGVFACADANVIYGFNEGLELISGFPLTGYGNPVFADVNGDKVSECLALTIDKNLVAWKMR